MEKIATLISALTLSAPAPAQENTASDADIARFSEEFGVEEAPAGD